MDGGGCLDFDGMVHTFRNNFMELYELDWDGDDYIVRLAFDDLSVTLSCPYYNQCVVTYSPPVTTWDNSVTRAEVAIKAYGSLVYK